MNIASSISWSRSGACEHVLRPWNLILPFLLMVAFLPNALAGHRGCDFRAGRDILQIESKIFIKTGDGALHVPSIKVACLSCHDGTVAKSIQNGGFDSTTRVRGKSSIPASNHPVGVRYPTNEDSFTPIPELDERIRLTNGQVTCLSCHSNLKQGSGMGLVMSNSRSRLCTSCHLR